MDYSRPGPSNLGVFQVRVLGWLPCPTPGDLLDPRMEPTSPLSPLLEAGSLPLEPPGKPLLNARTQLKTAPTPKVFGR